MKNLKYYIIISLIINLFLFTSCEKEPVATDNSTKSENTLKSDNTIIIDEIDEMCAYEYPSNLRNPYEYTGVWHLNILKRTKWYFVNAEQRFINADYRYSKAACVDILGRRVYTNELLRLEEINEIIRDLRSSYSNVIADSRFSPTNQAKLQALVNDIIRIFRKDMTLQDYYMEVIKTINTFESALPIPRVPLEPTELETIQAYENRVLLIMCSITRHSAFYWYNNMVMDVRHEPIDMIVEPINTDAQYAAMATAHALAAMAGTIKTCHQGTSMVFDVRTTCAASMTSAVSGF